MADVGTGTAGTLRLLTSVASQDVTNNTTTVYWELHILCGNGTSFQLSAKAWSANILGVGYSGTYTFDFRHTTDVLIGSGYTTVSANSDGTPVTGAVSGTIASSGTSGIGGPTTVNDTMSIPTIPRATQPTVSPTSGNFGATYTIDVSAAASSAFYHDFYYSLDGGSTYTSLFSNIPATTTTEPWTPASTLLPNAQTVTAILRVDTRSSSGGTVIGTKTVSLPLTVPSSVVPTISAVSFVDTQTSAPDMPTLMGGAGRFVQGWSILKPSVTSAGASGSSITASTVTQGSQVTSSGAAFGLPVSLSGAVPYSAVVTDSRNRNSVPFTGTVAVTAYNFPNLPTPTVRRTSDAAGLIPSPTGSYLNITPAASVSDLTFSASQKNLLEWQVRIAPKSTMVFTTVQAWTSTGVSGVTWTTPVTYGTYSSSNEYVVEVSMRDLFGKNGYNTANTVKVLTINVASEAVLWDLDRGDGIGIGQYRAGLGLVEVADGAGKGIYQGGNKVIDASNLATSSTPGLIKKATTTDLTSTDAAVTPAGLLSQLIAAAQSKTNRVINGGLRTNQDGYVSGTSIPIGSYAFDGYKASGVINLIPNSSFEGAAPTAIGCTATKDNTWSQIGSNSGKLVGTGTADSSITFGENVALSTFGLVIGKTYTLSGYCKVITPTSGAVVAVAARTRALMIQFTGPGTEFDTAQAVNTAGTITRVSTTFTVPVGATGVYLRAYLGTAAGTVQWDALMLTEGTVLYPAFDGNTTDCSFAGTANASFSQSVPNVVPTLTGTFDSNFGSLFTINTNGRISQIVERPRVPAGTYTVAHGGTATMRVYNNTTAPGSRPAFATGPITFAADGTDDVVVEFSGGGSGATMGQVRMFAGSLDFGFVLQDVADELRDCERYFYKRQNSIGYLEVYAVGYQNTTTQGWVTFSLPVPMRAKPFVQVVNFNWSDLVNFDQAVTATPSLTALDINGTDITLAVAFSANGAALRPGVLRSNSTPTFTNSYFSFDARIR